MCFYITMMTTCEGLGLVIGGNYMTKIKALQLCVVLKSKCYLWSKFRSQS